MKTAKSGFNYVTTAQAARTLGVTTRAVVHMVGRGEFPSARKVDPSKATSPFLILAAELKDYQNKKKRAQASTA